MLINTDNAIIKYSDKGKPFPYDKLFYATIEPYILEFKNCRLDKLTEEDAARCLARIFKRMEVNDVPVLKFFKHDLETMRDQSQYGKTTGLAELIARDIFCCFDKNRYDENGEFAVCDRYYCILDKDGNKDFIYAEEYAKTGRFGKKQLTPESKYFKELRSYYKLGKLPKEKEDWE
ncbi:hypothetical protein SAMN02910447_03526 [Ruminococcus sp. YE71]|uniref:hypothetical protein n=1 Tax=unclassified Ruminococcus TaxID=2608920 RepID=UPI00087EFF80|nr:MULTISPECIES: hypothetical protein [unclassified Ruminococcus]SDA32454.1 hypothetical protein SAMN02910446_03595 [Ruminococcus sp. YE78]SFW53412.1 hypothetical protein SAMN02910447_03526 [Ruminococcus sp. YE71]